MRIMGIDYGERRTGIAVSDPLGFTAQAVGTVNHKTPSEALSLVLDKINEIKPEKIVLGLPKNMDGSIGFRGEATQKFAEMLKENINLPIIFWDERLSTVSAIRTLNETNVRGKDRKKVIDTVAATYILQNYLDSI